MDIRAVIAVALYAMMVGGMGEDITGFERVLVGVGGLLLIGVIIAPFMQKRKRNRKNVRLSDSRTKYRD